MMPTATKIYLDKHFKSSDVNKIIFLVLFLSEQRSFYACPKSEIITVCNQDDTHSGIPSECKKVLFVNANELLLGVILRKILIF